MQGLCFITGKECEVTDFIVDGKVYKISEELSEENSVKALKKMISDKIESGQSQKKELVTKIEDMAKSMGVSKEDLLAMLGGKAKTDTDVLEEAPPIIPKQTVVKQGDPNDGFKAVDGELKSNSRASLSVEEGAGDYVTPASKAYSTVKTKDGKMVVETNKKVKTVGDVHLSKSDMGTTAIAIAPTNSDGVNRVISAVDKRTMDLVRGSASGGGRDNVGGGQARECPLCKGTGITQINNKVCVKCNGSGFIFC
jgi:hypothetical protein